MKFTLSIFLLTAFLLITAADAQKDEVPKDIAESVSRSTDLSRLSLS